MISVINTSTTTYFDSLIYHDDTPNLEVKKKTRGDPLYFNISKSLSLKHRAPSVPWGTLPLSLHFFSKSLRTIEPSEIYEIKE